MTSAHTTVTLSEQGEAGVCRSLNSMHTYPGDHSGDGVAETDLPEVYTNSARFTVGIYDFMVEFGVTETSVDPQKPPGIGPVLRVRMSPQHAAMLSLALADVVRRYENEVQASASPAPTSGATWV